MHSIVKSWNLVSIFSNRCDHQDESQRKKTLKNVKKKKNSNSNNKKHRLMKMNKNNQYFDQIRCFEVKFLSAWSDLPNADWRWVVFFESPLMLFDSIKFGLDFSSDWEDLDTTLRRCDILIAIQVWKKKKLTNGILKFWVRTKDLLLLCDIDCSKEINIWVQIQSSRKRKKKLTKSNWTNFFFWICVDLMLKKNI